MPTVVTIPFILLNVYLWWHMTGGRPRLRRSKAFAAVFLLLVGICVPFLLHWRPRGELYEFLLYVPWIWMAVVNWLAIPLFAQDAWNLLALGMSSLFKSRRLPLLSLRTEANVAFVCLVACIPWGLWEANFPRVNRITVEAPQLTEEIRIACISDLHLSPAPNPFRLNRVISLVNREEADLLVNLGDLSDGRGPRLERQVAELRRLRCKSGQKYAIVGNHEYRAGLDYARKLFELSGFRLLYNESVMFGEHLMVYGAEDRISDLLPRNPGTLDFPQHPADVFGLFLLHQPDPPSSPDDAHTVDLQLSGHTHGGQIFPNTILTRLRYHVKTGELLEMADGRKYLYIHRGTGVYGPPFRMGARSEVLVVTLKPPAQGNAE